MNKPARRSLTTSSANRAVLSLLFAVGVPALFAAPLQSPWDGKHVAITGAAYTCPAVAHIAPDLVTDGFYRLDDPTHSIIDPVRQEAYRKSSDPVKNIGLAIVAAADDSATRARGALRNAP
jgi:poly(beta-D-mannuronate) lyase